MGIEYALIKIDTGETYELGKTVMRPPVEDWKRHLKGLDPLKDGLAWQAVMQPSDRAVWAIGSDDGNCAATIMPDRLTIDRLADLVQTAFLGEDDPHLATGLANRIMEWAGRDRVVLVPDALDTSEVLERLGAKTVHTHTTRTLWNDAADLAPGDGGATS